MKWENLLSQKRLGEEILDAPAIEKKYPRSNFEKDYHRIVTSSSFRRLQDKTQVFPLELSDFVRTRLTHSIEVSYYAKILGSMCVKIIKDKESEEYCKGIYNIPDILMCAGLLHDIGNPPFGHFGEEVIREWFNENSNMEIGNKTLVKRLGDRIKDFCKFDGNAQAFRVLTRLHFTDSFYGMNLTSTVLNTLVKYPTGSGDIDSKVLQKKKMGFFENDRENFDKIASNTGTKNNKDNTYMRHPLTYFLEAADDIAYVTADLEDGFKKNLFTIDKLKNFFEEKIKEYESQKEFNKKQRQYTGELLIDLLHMNDIPKDCDNDLFAMRRWLSQVSSWFSYCAAYGFESNYDKIMDGTFNKDLFSGTFHHHSIKILEDAMKEFIFSNTQILKLELAAETILKSFLDKFAPAVISKCKIPGIEQTKTDKKLYSILSENYRKSFEDDIQKMKDENDRIYRGLLLVTDYISGMTDSFAAHLYKELNGIY